MKSVQRIMTNICSEELSASKNFYTKLFDFDLNFDSDWFIHLVSKDKQLELGIIDKSHEVVPSVIQNQPNGVYITFVVDSADDVFEIAKSEGFIINQEPIDTPYGQRRLLLQDPNGLIVDISSPIPDFKF